MAGGGMTSTLDDFAAFYQMHANGGSYRGRQILSERAVATMHTRQGKIELLMAGPYGNDYGIAFFLAASTTRERLTPQPPRFLRYDPLARQGPRIDRSALRPIQFHPDSARRSRASVFLASPYSLN